MPQATNVVTPLITFAVEIFWLQPSFKLTPEGFCVAQERVSVPPDRTGVGEAEKEVIDISTFFTGRTLIAVCLPCIASYEPEIIAGTSVSGMVIEFTDLLVKIKPIEPFAKRPLADMTTPHGKLPLPKLGAVKEISLVVQPTIRLAAGISLAAVQLKVVVTPEGVEVAAVKAVIGSGLVLTEKLRVCIAALYSLPAESFGIMDTFTWFVEPLLLEIRSVVPSDGLVDIEFFVLQVKLCPFV